MSEEITLRPVIREIMGMAAAREWTVQALHIQARRIVPGVEEATVECALSWNYGQGYVTRRKCHEMEQHVYKITADGLAA